MWVSAEDTGETAYPSQGLSLVSLGMHRKKYSFPQLRCTFIETAVCNVLWALSSPLSFGRITCLLCELWVPGLSAQSAAKPHALPRNAYVYWDHTDWILTLALAKPIYEANPVLCKIKICLEHLPKRSGNGFWIIHGRGIIHTTALLLTQPCSQFSTQSVSICEWALLRVSCKQFRTCYPASFEEPWLDLCSDILKAWDWSITTSCKLVRNAERKPNHKAFFDRSVFRVTKRFATHAVSCPGILVTFPLLWQNTMT